MNIERLKALGHLFVNGIYVDSYQFEHLCKRFRPAERKVANIYPHILKNPQKFINFVIEELAATECTSAEDNRV